jgi:flagellar hook-basal body complex protein FliE
MAGIDMISGLSPQMPRPGGAGGAQGAGAGGNFDQALKGALDKVDSQQQLSNQALQDVLTGQSGDVLPVVSAMAKADLSFKLLIGVRNKVIEAYKQTMNMQV